MFYLGIDVSKKSCRYLILNQEGQKIKSFSLDNTQEAFQNLLERLKTLSTLKDNLLIGLEASYWYFLGIPIHNLTQIFPHFIYTILNVKDFFPKDRIV